MSALRLSWLEMPLLLGVIVILGLVGLSYVKGDALKLTASVQPFSVRRGAQVKIGASLKNLGMNPLELKFPSSKTFDFEVSGENGHYRWSTDKFFLTVITKIELHAGQETDTAFTWTADLPSGDYQLTVFLEPISGPTIESQAVALIISD